MFRNLLSFPKLPGPFRVGTIELEIPVSSLLDTVEAGEGLRVNFEGKDNIIHTILFRVYYPTTGENPGNGTGTTTGAHTGDEKQGWSEYIYSFFRRGNERPVYWVPEPHQRDYLKGYLRFGGLTREWLINWIGGCGSILSHFLNNIIVPAIADSPLLESRQANSHFPTMIFSHGLGGTRLAYSHFCCSLASHGIIVFAPEHRDGSGPVSVVRTGRASEGKEYITELIPYVSIPHVLTQEMSEGRDLQLSIRFTELCLLYKALQSLHAGVVPKDTISGPSGQKIDGGCSELSMFKGKLDVESPGRVIWAGHSFGAATMVQFMKTVYYTNMEKLEQQASLLTLDEHQIGDLKRQITKNSPLLLLDLWSLSLIGSRRTYWLWKKPLPQVLPLGEEEGGGKEGEYDGSSKIRILTIMSHQFYIWKENMWAVKWVLSRDPGRRDGGVKEIFNYDPITGKKIERSLSSTGNTTPYPETATGVPDGFDGYRPPKLYYAKHSAHLTHSDFNLLFPFMFRKHVSDVQKVFSFNIRATVQWLREVGFRHDLQQLHESVEGDVDDPQIFGNSETEEELDGEEKSRAAAKLKGWVKLALHEEPVKKNNLEAAVTGSIRVNTEGDLEVET